MAATLAVGVGLALARAERERRGGEHRGRRRRRRLGLSSHERLGDGARRMAAGQAELTIELLGAEERVSARTVHETRKALKRLQALLRLLKRQLGKQTYARESQTLRALARRLAGARDAEVMLATLDELIARHPRRLGRRAGVLRLRERLLAERERIRRRTLDDDGTRALALAELRAFHARVQTWRLPEEGDMELVQDDLRRLYRQGRKRYRRALRGKGEQTLVMHAWRKRVKDLRYAAEILQRRGAQGRLRELARRADQLGELLGEDHDLAIFAERLRAGARWDGREAWRTGRKTRRLLLRAVAKRRRELRRRALRKGARLYDEKPARFVRRVRVAYDSDASERSRLS